MLLNGLEQLARTLRCQVVAELLALHLQPRMEANVV
jgi:hypothetical protein